MRSASTVMMSPPVLVQARPVTVPISGSVSAAPTEKRGVPRISSARSMPISHALMSPSALARARLRSSDASERSNVRSPASRE
jgi:hypothetical protein